MVCCLCFVKCRKKTNKDIEYRQQLFLRKIIKKGGEGYNRSVRFISPRFPSWSSEPLAVGMISSAADSVSLVSAVLRSAIRRQVMIVSLGASL